MSQPDAFNADKSAQRDFLSTDIPIVDPAARIANQFLKQWTTVQIPD
jgi:hypothetical protein